MLTHDDITFMRAKKLGLSPDKLEIIINKKLNKDIRAFDTILKNDLL